MVLDLVKNWRGHSLASECLPDCIVYGVTILGNIFFLFLKEIPLDFLCGSALGNSSTWFKNVNYNTADS